MILKIFTVLDKAVGAYLQPFFAQSKGEAIRSFSDAVNTPDHNFHKHASDFALYDIGEYDNKAGIVVGWEPVRVISADEVMNIQS